MSTELTIDGRKNLMESLEKGQVAEVEYVDEDGNTQTSKGVVCKANKGIVVMVRQDTRKKLVCMNGSGHVYWTTGVGSTKMKHTMGRKGVIRPTGETASVTYKDMRGGWMTDWKQ